MSTTPKDMEADIEKPPSGVSTPELRDAEAHESKQANPNALPTWQWILTLVGLYLGALLYGLDTTIAADVQTAVYERFDDIELLPWVGIGFPMASVAGIMVIGRLYGVFNIKILLIGSIVLFEAGSALCGGAPSMNALIVGRVIAGLGGCGMYIGALTYLSVFSGAKRLALYNALIGLCWGVGAILGPVIGGAFSVSSATWRWAFYINLPLAALSSPAYIFAPSFTAEPGVPALEKLKRFDWTGVVLNGGSLVILVVALTFSGSTYAWSSGSAIALWVVCGVTTIIFCAQQGLALFTTPEQRIFPIHFWRDRTMVLLFICTACAATANATTLYYVPLFFSFTRGDDALQAAVRLLPFIIVFIVFVMLAGASLPVLGRYAPFYTIGGALALAGSVMMFTIRSDTSTGFIYGAEVLIAAGSGLVFQNAYAIASAKVDKDDKANAIGFINFSQIGMTAIALAIAGCLYQNLGFDFLKDALRQFNLPDSFLQAALGGVSAASLGSASKEVVDLTVSTVAYTIARIFGMTVASSALLLVSSLLMKQEKIDLSETVVAGG